MSVRDSRMLPPESLTVASIHSVTSVVSLPPSVVASKFDALSAERRLMLAMGSSIEQLFDGDETSKE